MVTVANLNNFRVSLAFSLKWEGNYEPAGTGDPGGETKWGISKRAYPDLDIANLTADQASDTRWRSADRYTPSTTDGPESATGSSIRPEPEL